MSKIIKVWLYRATDVKEHNNSDCKHLVKNVERGDFKYYRVDGNAVEPAYRKDADEQERITGDVAELYLGYPSFMFDLGYRT